MNNLICLCGSTRFASGFIEANAQLTLQGFSVLSISMVMEKDAKTGEEKNTGRKDWLDLIHFNKILRSDGVFIVGDGYIGRSTAREILWADMQEKPIIGCEDYKPGEWRELGFALKHELGHNMRWVAKARAVLDIKE